ncbi:permease [Halomonas sp. ND22Bw]|uniref:Permease n=1 Tax=Halomonas salina TaxID=42565 RepID=A0ABR4WX57_9GAMM|nr:permease [Halomonas salina]KGE79322.1 permease [Halomonas salina]PSJ21980.1 permease [Halomonas sp. ND22Bw]
MTGFLTQWHEAAITSLGFFWMALWAFVLGYLISSLIQVLVSRERMQRAMGRDGPRSMLLGTFFGFISSSCSFAALATTRALFQKGAGLAPSMAFLLSSTNLVVELGFVIAIFLGWPFVVGEYVGGVMLILFAWAFIRLTSPDRLIARVRERLGGEDDGDDDDTPPDWRRRLTSREGWERIARTYVMEWQMVWKDVLIGFSVAGIIAAFVPRSFFQALFPGAGTEAGALELVAQAVIGPVAAFFTFIGSMGNIPLAAVLFDNGVSFAGVMAFIFSDLVVLPVLRINARYYGWKMAFYLLAALLSGLVLTALLLHLGMDVLGALPDASVTGRITEREFFALNYGFFLNLAFLAMSVVLIWLWWRAPAEECHHHHHAEGSPSLGARALQGLVALSLAWLAGGLLLAPLIG